MAYLKPFNWKYSSVFAPALWGLGFGATLSGQYLAAYMFYFIGGVWLLGWWATGHPSPRKREEQTELTKKQLGQLRTRWLGAFSIAFFAVASCLWNYRLKKEHQLDLLYGVLIPAADNAPPTSCDAIAKPADLKLLIGNMTVLAKKLPMVVVAIRIDKDDTIRRDLISIDRNDKGQIVITSDVVGDDGKLIARISKNELTVSEFKIFRTHHERPDESTLDLQDEYGKQVLYVRYLNSRSLKFLGRLHYQPIPSVGFVIENDKGYTLGAEPGFVTSGVCYAMETPTAILIALRNGSAH